MKPAWPRIVAHADMDAFYAAIEQLDDPSLRGRPILVGSPKGRGVVLTASYEARPYGVGSALPMAKARRMCPDAIITPPRFKRYQQVSETIMRVFSDFSPDVEAISLDEAFLDMTGSEQLFGAPEKIGRQIKDAIRDATGGLTISVGLSGTKYVAKVASAYQKPDGLTVVPPSTAKAWLAPLPISRLWGAGPKTQKRIHQIGLQTIGDVAAADPKFLAAKLGSAGLHFYTLAHGEDPRRVARRRTSKSIGSERTLGKDVRTRADIEHQLRRSADAIGRRLRRKHYRALGVRVKLKTSDFQLLTRQRLLDEPTDVAQNLLSVGVDLLHEFRHPGPFRLVGMAAYDLVKADDPVQLGLFQDRPKRRNLEEAIDRLAERFGNDVVRRAEDLCRPQAMQIDTNLDFLDEDLDETGNDDN
ncbi:DNA polymerase IV [bacterium MnTg02]|nr:DNA polymerase IV [bacterium MnTg02]